VSIRVGHGEFFGILGPNGAGKTTLLEIIEGLREADSGTVQVLGEPGWPRNPKLLNRIGVQLQEVQKGDEGAAVEQQQNTLVLHYSTADPVVAGTVQGTFSAFVDQTNIQVAGVPPTYTLQTQQVEDESLQPIQYIAPGMIGYRIGVGAVFGAALTLITWREKKLLRRLRPAPVSTSSVVGSRVSVSMAAAIGQLILFVGISVLPFLGLKLSGAWYMAIPLVMADGLPGGGHEGRHRAR
jgi:ABC-2 type transport system permease protein